MKENAESFNRLLFDGRVEDVILLFYANIVGIHESIQHRVSALDAVRLITVHLGRS